MTSTLHEEAAGAVYVSSKLRHRSKWLSSGIPTVASWIHGEQLPPSECSAMWNRYRNEIARCDGFVLYVEPEDQLKGCLLELGMAFATGCRIVIVWSGGLEELADKIGTVVYHASVAIVATIDEAKTALRGNGSAS